MIRLKKYIVLISFLFCFVISTHASEKNIEIRTIGFPPFGINHQGELSGIFYDLANLVIENAGYTANNQISPYARIIKEIKVGKIDLTIMFRHGELDPYVQYIAPLPAHKTVIIGLQDSSFKSMADLSGKKVTYLRGSKFSYKIANDKTIIKYPVKNFIQGIKMLNAGRVDAIIGPLLTIESSALEVEKIINKTIEFGDFLVVDKRTPWIQVSNKSKSKIDIEKLKESYAQLEEADTLNSLFQKYRP